MNKLINIFILSGILVCHAEYIDSNGQKHMGSKPVIEDLRQSPQIGDPVFSVENHFGKGAVTGIVAGGYESISYTYGPYKIEAYFLQKKLCRFQIYSTKRGKMSQKDVELIFATNGGALSAWAKSDVKNMTVWKLEGRDRYILQEPGSIAYTVMDSDYYSRHYVD